MFLSRTNLLPKLLKKTIIRYAIRITGVMLAQYILFNVFFILLLDVQLETHLDRYISHEIKHFLNSFYLDDDSLIISNSAAFNESDLVYRTDNPFFLQIYSKEGKLWLQSQNLKNYQPIPLEFPELADQKVGWNTLKINGEILRSGYQKLFSRQSEFVGYLQLSTPKATALIISRNIIWFNVISFPFMLFLTILISFLIAKRSFKPINEIIDLANKISAKNLKERLSFKADPDDEIGRLRDTLNHLFDRLEQQIQQIAHFTDDASHQLMSPLTVMNAELELLVKKYSTSEISETIFILQEQTRRMIHIVKTLLILAKDCKSCMDNRSVFSLMQLLQNEIKPMFLNQNVVFQIENEALLRGNKDYFAIALQNLIDNAIKYSPKNSQVSIRIVGDENFIHISVADQGFGISAAEKSQLFERFYRGSRAQKVGIQGFGLGLSLVKSIVSAMNGTIDVKDNQPNGSIFTISLPKLQTE